MRNKGKSAVFILGLLAVSGPLTAEETSLPREAQEILEKAARLQSFKAHFTLEAKEEEGKPFLLRGTLIYREPSRRRLEIREQEAQEITQLLVSDGKVEMQYYPRNNAAYRIPNPPAAPGPHRPFMEAKPESVRFVERLEGPGGLLRFEGEPRPESVRGSPVPIAKIRLDVSEQDGLLRELVLLDEQGEPALTQRFTDVEINVPAPDELFLFTVPEGVSVMEAPPVPAAQEGT